MPKLDFTRRQVLRGVGGFSLAVPAFYPRAGRAAQAGVPKRLVLFFVPEGRWQAPNDSPNNAWFPVPGPTKATTDFSMVGGCEAPLEPYKKKLTFVQGINAESTKSDGSCFHVPGITHVLTGGPKGAPVQYQDPITNATVTAPGGISVDQLLAKAIKGNAPISSMELGVLSNIVKENVCVSFDQAGAGRYPQNSPYKAFGKLFGGGTTPGSDLAKAAEEAHQRRLSVLDLVATDLANTRCQLGGEAQQKLDSHLTNIRSIEKQVTDLGVKKTTAPTLQIGPEWDARSTDNARIPELVKLQMDLAAAALTADLLRVVTIQIGFTSNHMTFPFVPGLPTSLQKSVHHAFAHSELAAKDSGLSYSECRVEYKKVYNWFSTQFAYLLGKLENGGMKEANGLSLLDNSLVMRFSEMGAGGHQRNDYPIILAGGAQRTIKMGNSFDLNPIYNNFYGSTSAANRNGVSTTGRSLNDLHFTICSAFGINLNRFGEAAAWRGTIPQLLA